MFSDLAWKRHLELKEGASPYMGEHDWQVYFYPGRTVFLNEITAQEFEQPMTEREQHKLQWSDVLLCCSPLIHWPADMKPEHYGRDCRRVHP